jgi:hypothetical protein
MDDEERDFIGEFFKHKKWYDGPLDKKGILTPREVSILDQMYRGIKEFFSDKSWYCGGPVPESTLYSLRSFRLVRNLPLEKALDIGFKGIKKAKLSCPAKYSKNSDTELSMKLLRECGRRNIPQEYIGGLFILYLELCEKIDLS